MMYQYQKKTKACKLSATKTRLAFKKQLNNPNQDHFDASPTLTGWAKADNFDADSIVLQFKKLN